VQLSPTALAQLHQTLLLTITLVVLLDIIAILLKEPLCQLASQREVLETALPPTLQFVEVLILSST
jgi:hypothetical protein